jgi:hypothetical protein
MDFMNRGGQPAAAPAAPQQHQSTSRNKKERSKTMRIVSAILLISVALLVAAVAFKISTSVTKSESSYIDDNKYQAVFLNGGQVYFGKIKSMNGQFLTLNSIYYLRVNDQAAADQNQQADTDAAGSQDISLAKLGCELHGPEDEMVINREQVTFWENLKDDGQVVKAITEFVKANPDGQKCTTT